MLGGCRGGKESWVWAASEVRALGRRGEWLSPLGQHRALCGHPSPPAVGRRTSVEGRWAPAWAAGDGDPETVAILPPVYTEQTPQTRKGSPFLIGILIVCLFGGFSLCVCVCCVFFFSFFVHKKLKLNLEHLKSSAKHRASVSDW